MVDNKTNIFDLVEEVNKEKKKSSMAVEKEINDIYSMLDDIKKDNDISVEDVRDKVNAYSTGTKKKVSSEEKLSSFSSNLVKKPVVPESVNADIYSDNVLAYISSVDYGQDNSKEYVKGHKEALEKYYLDIKSNKKDLYVVEARLNDEINSNSSKSSLKDKGYYDGLLYVLKSFKKSKETVTDKINRMLIEKIG